MSTFIRRLLPLLLLTSLPVTVPAATPEVIAINCAHPALPSQQTVSRLLNVSNFGQAYAARAHLMAQAVALCRSGAPWVRFTADARVASATGLHARDRRLVLLGSTQR